MPLHHRLPGTVYAVSQLRECSLVVQPWDRSTAIRTSYLEVFRSRQDAGVWLACVWVLVQHAFPTGQKRPGSRASHHEYGWPLP